VGAPQNAKLLSKGRHRLASRLVAALDIVDSFAFRGCVDAKDPALFEQSQHLLVGPSLGYRSRILPITS
jgi:hypothetical protein